MTSNVPLDSAGNPLTSIGEGPLHRSDEKPKPHSHLPTRLHRYVERKISAALVPAMGGVKDALYERDERIAALEKQVADLRRQLDMQRQIATITARLDRLEADGGTTISVRPTSNGAHHHDG